MSVLEKQKTLDLVFNTLKSEFVGLDNIIDELKVSISPWYLTPEVIDRPVVVSLWGMTGTGKTSVVKRLIKLLNLENKALFFDCGLEAGDGSSGSNNISENIVNKIGMDEYEGNVNEKFSDMIFVFDEFQYARTINEVGEELLKSPLRPIWSIIDDGSIDISESKYEISRVINLIDDFSSFIKRTGIDPKMSEGEFINKEEVQSIKKSIELKKYYRDSYPIYNNPSENSNEENEDEENASSNISFFDEYYFSSFIKKLNTIDSNKLGYEFIDKFLKVTKSSEVIKLFNEYKKYVTRPRILECNKSLVFILGNLDEAFGVEKELNPDYDADVFKDITESVTISDIKDALKKRFRAEQIARFGNNLIKYPTLGKKDFTKIIEKETSRILDEFYKLSGVKVVIGEDMINLLYSEGVYPVQGVRPVFTTIGLMFTPLLSDILINKEESDSEITIKLKNIDDWKLKSFKIPEISILIEFNGSKKSLEKIIKLQLGSLRNPKNKKTRYITSVHESGHAIVSMYLNGEYPISVVSVSTDDGGFCDTHIKENIKEIDSREDVDNEVMICLGGYKAEELVYGETDKKCLMGSSSDLYNAWEILSDSIYRCGYLNPIRFSCHDTESMTNIPSGLSSKKENIDGIIKELMANFEKKVENVLKSEKRLLKEMSLYLGEHGSLPIEILKDMVSKYGNKLTPDYMKEKKKEMSGLYYYEKLNNLI